MIIQDVCLGSTNKGFQNVCVISGYSKNCLKDFMCFRSIRRRTVSGLFLPGKNTNALIREIAKKIAYHQCKRHLT